MPYQSPFRQRNRRQNEEMPRRPRRPGDFSKCPSLPSPLTRGCNVPSTPRHLCRQLLHYCPEQPRIETVLGRQEGKGKVAEEEEEVVGEELDVNNIDAKNANQEGLTSTPLHTGRAKIIYPWKDATITPRQNPSWSKSPEVRQI